MGRKQRYSEHGARRSQQRGVNETAIQAAMDWGQLIHQRGGRKVYYLGHSEVAEAMQAGVDLRCHQNIAVIVGSDGTIITTMRAKRPKQFHQGARLRRNNREQAWAA